jgi:hypothetical protein
MSYPRVKIDVFDKEGNKISISLEGNITRKKVLHVLDLIELLNGASSTETVSMKTGITKYDKLQVLIEREFPLGWFSSEQIHVAYEDAYIEPIGISTVSTYLSRLTKRGRLLRKGSRGKRMYRINRMTFNEQQLK